jgi:hypothetical protein
VTLPDAVSRTLAGAFVYKALLSFYSAESYEHMVSLGRTPLMDDTMAGVSQSTKPKGSTTKGSKNIGMKSTGLRG